MGIPKTYRLPPPRLRDESDHIILSERMHKGKLRKKLEGAVDAHSKGLTQLVRSDNVFIRGKFKLKGRR